MRLHQIFRRDKGATKNPALGTDVLGTSAAPVSAGGLAAALTGPPNKTQSGPYTPVAGAPTTNDGSGTVLVCPFKTVDGWPAQRIVVATRADWASSAATTANLAADGYLWEVLTGTWQKVNASPVTLTPGVLAYFDCVGLGIAVQNSTQAANAGGVSSAGAIEFMLVVSDGGSTSNGTFTFAMGPDTTSNP